MNVLNYTRKMVSWQTGLPAGPRDTVIDAMLKTLCEEDFYTVNPELSHEGIMQALIAREAQRTTAVGQEIAFPHARLEHLRQALFAVGIVDDPVMFEEFPVRIICLLLIPASEPSVSLKTMAQISRILMVPEVHRQVLEAPTPEALRAIFKQNNPRIDKPIVASDIMRPPRSRIRDTDLVSKCSHLMSVNNLQAVPVVDSRNRILGEITVERLFRYGLPDFFAKLKSVSFIAEFDPFEKYFADERNIPVGEIMEPNARIVPMDYTIMEIVFDLAIRSFLKLYVTDAEGRWVGTIDKSTVLDNVINY
ncbi:MAG: PTS sugar transporter subunit IIA [Kiritimatiellales bacterium]|nr:PTS sugar transporter subunit IIA [Kiritimatiellales bacterium]